MVAHASRIMPNTGLRDAVLPATTLRNRVYRGDPEELTNVAGIPASVRILESMREALARCQSGTRRLHD
jgi:hypothetical protein